ISLRVADCVRARTGTGKRAASRRSPRRVASGQAPPGNTDAPSKGGDRSMGPAIIVVISVLLVGALIWRASASSPEEQARQPTRPMIQRERRRGSRVVPPSDKPAELQIMGPDFLEIPEVRDISENGLAITVPHRFNGQKPTAEVDLLLTLHGQGTV